MKASLLIVLTIVSMIGLGLGRVSCQIRRHEIQRAHRRELSSQEAAAGRLGAAKELAWVKSIGRSGGQPVETVWNQALGMVNWKSNRCGGSTCCVATFVLVDGCTGEDESRVGI